MVLGSVVSDAFQSISASMHLNSQELIASGNGLQYADDFILSVLYPKAG